MKQYDAINKITEIVINDGLIEACFIKGSLARGEEDLYSDVDLYFVVSDEYREAFLKKRIEYLKSYDEILYFSEVNFVGPQIVCIFENGLHLDLYTVSKEKIDNSGKIIVIYDPKGLLDNYEEQSSKLSNQEVGKIINGFSYTLYEFYNSYMRKDHLFSFKLAFYLYDSYIQILRFFQDPEYSKIPCKGFLKKMSKDQSKELLEITKLLKIDTTLLSVKTLIIVFNNLIINLPITIAQEVNYDFFLYTKTIVNGLDEEN